MPSPSSSPQRARLRQVAAVTPGLQLLLLFGSRATGRAHARSDWDLGYLGSDDLDPGRLHSDIASAIGTDDVDIVDLAGAGALLRFNAADIGALMWEDHPGRHERFWLDAVHFWCDAGPLIRAAYDEVLEALG